jgi:hypothetical protein
LRPRKLVVRSQFSKTKKKTEHCTVVSASWSTTRGCGTDRIRIRAAVR